MANPSPEDRALAGRLSRPFEAGALGAVALGFAVSVGLLLLYGAWETAFGHLRYLAEHSWLGPETIGPRIALTVTVLTGFMVGGHVYGRRELARDIEDLAPLLDAPAQERQALIREVRGGDGRASSWIAALVAIPIGLFVVTAQRTGVPYLVSDEPWSHDLVWALACNALLFSILGWIAVQTFRTNELFARVEARLRPVDLLRPHALGPFARRGLRMAFLWIGGSSIGSIIFVNQSFSLLTGVTLVATLLLGTLAFLLPVRGLRRRIRAAKEAELERVRVAIERARTAMLGDAGDADAAAARMPGLIAYEHRIASVPEWPLDAPQIARFGLMVALGLGSWLGGAVVGHLVDVFWR